jgi:hypothetical protein
MGFSLKKPRKLLLLGRFWSFHSKKSPGKAIWEVLCAKRDKLLGERRLTPNLSKILVLEQGCLIERFAVLF